VQVYERTSHISQASSDLLYYLDALGELHYYLHRD